MAHKEVRSANDAPSFKQHALSEYEHNLTRFREQFLLLVYLTSGQPSRTTVIMNFCHMNTLYGGGRNIFLSGGYVCVKTWYYKGVFRT